MKWISFPLLGAIALLAAVVAVPLQPAAKDASVVFTLDVTVTSSAAGTMQLFYDNGAGYQEALSSRASVRKSNTPATVHLALPPGNYRSLRLDPLDRAATMIMSDLRIVASDNHVVRVFPLSSLHAANQIASMRRAGQGVVIATAPDADDPQLAVELLQPLVLRATWHELLAGFWLHAGGVFAAMLVLVGAGRYYGLRRMLGHAWSRALRHPTLAVAGVAAAAVAVSAYPVVLLGASYVSPNFGSQLLYESYPTLPGYADSQVVDPNGSDVGAIIWQHVPFSMLQRRALLHGELPLWNRYSAGGVPLLGQGQSMFGDPLQFLVIAANGAAWAWDLKFLVAKWLFALALGLTVLAMNRKHTPGATTWAENGTDAVPSVAAALIVALAAPFLGFFVYRINHPAVFSLCYSPWVLFCWIRAVQATNRRSFAGWALGLIAANVALMNSGTAKEAYMLLLSLNFSGCCVLLFSGAPWRIRLAKLAALMWGGVLFALLTAPVWLTFLAALRQSYTSYNAVSAYQIQPGLLLGAFDEAFYRPIMVAQRTFDPSVNFIVLLGLAYFAATTRLTLRDRTSLALAVSSAVPLAFAFGIIPARWVVQVPFLANVAHLDNSFSCVLIVLWSVLAGVGLARASVRLGTRDGRDDLLIVAVLIAGLVAMWIGFSQAVHRAVFGAGTTYSPLPHDLPLPVSNFIWGYLITLLLAAAIGSFLVRRAMLGRRLTVASGIVIALCAMLMLGRQAFHGQAFGFETFVVRPPPRVDFHARSAAVETVRQAVSSEPARAFGLEGNLFPGWTVVYGLETITGPDALANPFWRELTGALPGVQRIWDWRLYLKPIDVSTARRGLDALNVGYYLDLPRDQGLLSRSLRLIDSADLDVYASPTAWPRAFFTDRIATYDKVSDFVAMIEQGDGRPFAAVERSDTTAHAALPAPGADLAQRSVVRATNYRLTENTTAFDVHASGPGVVVLNEAYWPGEFRAEVNGQRTPIVRVNHALEGVPIRVAGDYHVVFRCLPKGFPRNLMLCGLGAVLLALSLAWSLRRKTNAPPPARGEPSWQAS